MTMNEYQLLAQRTAKITDNPADKLLNGCMGLNGEAGECINLLKKHLFQGHELDRKKLAEELGDVLWYCAELACGLGVTLEEVAQRNIDKLRRRYPEGEQLITNDGINCFATWIDENGNLRCGIRGSENG